MRPRPDDGAGVISTFFGAVVFVGDGKGAEALEPFWLRLRRSRAKVVAVATEILIPIVLIAALLELTGLQEIDVGADVRLSAVASEVIGPANDGAVQAAPPTKPRSPALFSPTACCCRSIRNRACSSVRASVVISAVIPMAAITAARTRRASSPYIRARLDRTTSTGSNATRDARRSPTPTRFPRSHAAGMQRIPAITDGNRRLQTLSPNASRERRTSRKESGG